MEEGSSDSHGTYVYKSSSSSDIFHPRSYSIFSTAFDEKVRLEGGRFVMARELTDLCSAGGAGRLMVIASFFFFFSKDD